MNQHLQKILGFIEHTENLSAEEKAALTKSVKDTDNDFSITEIKLASTEKVKKTTAILLEETIEELEQKRKAIEAQNRELKIESSLEKVRSIALAMKEPADMLEVCSVIATELYKLGVKEIRNVQTAIFYESKGTYMNYEYYAKHNKTIITETSYTNHEIHRAFADQMLKGTGEFFSTHMSEAELPNWVAYQKTTNVFIDSYLETASSLNYYWHSLGPVALGISTYISLSEEAMNLFKRFLKVFELAYRRFLDIEQAMLQAREAQIELALERVRARTMAMQKSDELAETSFVLFQQFKDLGETSEQISIGIFNEDENIMELYSTLYGSQWKEAARVDLDEPVVMKKIKAGWKKQNRSLVIDLAGNNLQKYNAYRKKLSNLEYKANRWVIHVAFFSKGVLTFSTTEPHPHETIQLLERCAGVFDGTYTRFLDLQKAESQAREAKVELSLERVRAKAMAMHTSEELKDVVKELRNQIGLLGQNELDTCVIQLYDESPDYIHSWASMTPSANKEEIREFNRPVPKKGLFIIEESLKAYSSGLKDYILLNEKRKLKQWMGFMKETYPDIYAVVIEAMGGLEPENVPSYWSYSDFSGGALLMVTLTPPAEISRVLLRKFANVFGLAYRRFVDLKQAEAQARESQIELSLERVRAKTMAMHKSNEVMDVAVILYDELQKLDFKFGAATIIIMDEKTGNMEHWLAGFIQKNHVESYQVNNGEHPLHVAQLAGWREGAKFVSIELSGPALKSYAKEMFTQSGYRNLPDEEKAMLSAQEHAVFNLAYMSHGALMWAPSAISDENAIILQRFAKVFEQTYTRFLDLQKVEAQAREATIEAALEKVRSRSLAMHKSEELKEVVATVFEKLQELNFAMNDGAAIIMTFIKDSKDHIQWIADRIQAFAASFKVPYSEHSLSTDIFNAKESGVDFFSKLYPFEEKNTYFKYLFENVDDYKVLPDEVKELLLQSKDYGMSIAFEKNSAIFFASNTGKLVSENEKEILKRFAKVFEQSYIRFLDLQKAEAQAREAQIEAALERIRSSAMAMHSSEGILEVTHVLREQIALLGEKELESILVHIYHEDVDQFEAWYSYRHPDSSNVEIVNGKQVVDWSKTERARKDKEKYHEKESDYTIVADHKMLKEWYEYLFKLAPEVVELNDKGEILVPDVLYYNYSKISGGALLLITNSEASDHSKYLLKRAAKVFNLAYSRFLDLQNAEVQTKESQIQLALERVRATTMAMQKSDELREVVVALYEQLRHLHFDSKACNIIIIDKESNNQQYWVSGFTQDIYPESYNVPYFKHPYVDAQLEAWKKGEKYVVIEYSGKTLRRYDEIFFAQTDFKKIPEEAQKYMRALELVKLSTAYFNYGALQMIGASPLTEENANILQRFAKVFEQTYTRFLDLQKAEAQTREAQIEASLERVRSRAMAMQKSDDLANALAVVFEELDKLDLGMLRCGIGIINKGNRSVNVWAATKSDNVVPVQVSGDESMDTHPLLQGAFNAWLKQEEYSYVLQGEDLTDYYKAQVSANFKLPDSHSLVTGNENVHQYYFLATFPAGGLFAFRETAFSEESKVVMKRFTDVFNLTYTRYNDLQQAEAQTRQAKIEAAMERVRARAMAMQKPGELVKVAELLRREMGLLGVEELETSSIYIHDESSGTTECWYAIQDIRAQDKKLVTDYMAINLDDTWVGREMLEFYTSGQKQTSILMQGENRKEWINYCAQHSEVLQGYYGEVIPERTYHLLKFSNGYMGAASPGSISAESWDLLKRATTVFSLAYTRFSDLQQAEASTKEAVKQAALDRIRAEIASMRTIDDLERITPLIWTELTILGVAFIRCGVFIMDNANELIHTFLSTPEGKAIAAFHIPYTTPGNIEKVLSHWQHKKNYVDHWDEAAFTEFAGTLINEGALVSPEEYLETIPRGGFYLHFLPFLQGMLYVGNTTQLDEEEIKLIQSVADAFSTAYARYEDFNKLEAAKQQVDKTLVDLKQAQTQLVQSEKMASLGELTAGIAHEIQNPLNFVNNFSEVNKEMLGELNEEIDKGNYDDAKAIAKDVIANEEIINHHGKRADAIVKGMLQHSRQTSGTKEPTDINALCDEYLRLAYHGLRAKEKEFNADFKTDFDESIGKVNVVPQDIGRVLLNLYNNAFYAVNEKKRSINQEGFINLPGFNYEPTVTVQTKKINDKVEIIVRDNGNGIPQNIVGKIFQPFFTTKPTGQGTGLGLSLSYDIIKAHGGEIKVESKEGKGTTFVIQLAV